ncbi:AAA family ATPase [Shewanella baltica]|uniref:anticodon nuclease n=1 Tax=Shewanella baltica TaxID=62322 RepID=UPI00217D1434|nr:anticodon nuclease [Shewanella baltica]MCS6129334.1 AAA family ATPase [Shewanella baltica]MCS6141353.1 AAA family ATPase [Shewanella baltica]MCS6147601.1 AAA family ATPase [Shewanella baltica]MCS6172167.1 AAA family ATPase [Shewanella baltica]MCS6189355.1 AAA family ATPase [Shewanella baltica]
MSKMLTEIALQLKDANKKVQLIYAFNGTGKTRLSREFKTLIAPKVNGAGDEAPARAKILYHNAFTEDLFYWDNDLQGDTDPKLKIQPNSYTDWLLTLLKDLGQDTNIVRYFQHYANDKLTPQFSEDFTEVTFSLERGDDVRTGNLKISKGEESNFIWSIFYTLLDQVITILNVAELTERETNQFDQLEYVFIDDPVSSLDENHLIELAVNLAGLIKSSKSDLKFIVTTHSPLFYNVLFNELNGKTCYLLERFEDGTFALTEKHGDSNKSFSYHLYLKQTIEQAIADNKVEKYHFTLLRNLYEKTASFLGYPKWADLLPDDKQLYLSRILNFTSHSTLSNETVAEPTPAEQAVVKLLLDHLKNNYGFWKQEQQNG